MTLIKTIAAYNRFYQEKIIHEDGNHHIEDKVEWIEQKDIEMHPLEEDVVRKYWAINDVSNKIPSKPTQQEEHEFLIFHGADYVKQKRAEWQAIHDSIKPELDAAEKAYQDAHNYWNNHVALCIGNGHNPDTFQGDANLLLNKEGDN